MADGDLSKYSTYSAYQEASRKGGASGAGEMASVQPALSLKESLPQMMYGFGEDEAPLPETVALMEQLVFGYIRDVTDEACKTAEVKGRLDTDCFVFAVRRDKPKYKRMKEIIELSKHVDRSTQQRFTESEMAVFHPSFPLFSQKVAVASIALLAPVETEPAVVGSTEERLSYRRRNL